MREREKEEKQWNGWRKHKKTRSLKWKITRLMQFMYHYQMMLLIRNRNRSSNRKRAVERERVLYFCDVRSEFLCAECRVHSRDIYSLFHSSTYASTRPWLSVCVCVSATVPKEKCRRYCRCRIESHKGYFTRADFSLGFFVLRFAWVFIAISQSTTDERTNERVNECWCVAIYFSSPFAVSVFGLDDADFVLLYVLWSLLFFFFISMP